MFGRPMNNFENYGAELEQTPIEKRALDIRQLIEESQPAAQETIREKQVAQKNNQNKRQSSQDYELELGEKVTVKSLKIQGKLQNNYVGIYEIDGKTPNGNYWLKNAQDERLKQSFPLSRLKLVNNEVELEEHWEVERIINHRKRNGEMQYLTKWKGFDETTWEPESNFDTTEIIEEYWAARHNVNYVKPFQWIWKLALIFMVIGMIQPAQAIRISENFRFCNTGENKAIWDISNSCEQERIPHLALFKASILTKMSSEVSGKG